MTCKCGRQMEQAENDWAFCRTCGHSDWSRDEPDWAKEAMDIFETIKHGDEAHQAWLKDTLLDWAMRR